MPEKTQGERDEEHRKAILKKLKNMFGTFDRSNNGTCDVRDMGTVIRSLGMFSSEQRLVEMIRMMEDPEPTGFIRFEKFCTVMTEIMESNEFVRHDEETIYRAFLALDTEKNGYLTPDQLTQYMTSEGEVFGKEEMEEMLSACVDPTEGKIYYEDYVTILAQ